MSKYKVDDTQLAGIADALRTKTESSDLYEFPNGFINTINGITPQIIETSQSVSHTITSARNVSANSVSQLGFFTITGKASPPTGISFNPTFTNYSLLSVVGVISSSQYLVYVRNASNLQITIPKNTNITVTYKEYTASL